MSGDMTTFLEVGAVAWHRRIACLVSPGDDDGRPGLVWLPGFNSTMSGIKARELTAWASRQGLAMTRFDYSGHGQSSGKFEDGTISHWLEESHVVLERHTTGPQILVGSSMGGWIALLMARRVNAAKPGRIAGLVLIAPAWDMTERLMWLAAPEEVRRTIENEGVWLRPSEYDDDNYPITKTLIEDGRKHLFGEGPVEVGCPVRILHGLADPDVPWQGSHTLIERLDADDAILTLVRGAGHRLSRPQDMRLLKEMISGLLDG